MKMTKTYTMLLILALGAPAAAEFAAPELPFIDAAVVRSQPFEKESINIGAAFPGMQACKFTGVQGDTCSFACKDGSTVKRPRINSTVAQNGGCPTMVMVPAAAPKAAVRLPIYNGTYTNDAGCIVQAENGAKGTVLYIENLGNRAMLGILNDLSGGDIAAFCRPAEAAFAKGVLTLGCPEQDNGGYPTRGFAEVDLRGGLNAVRVRGQVKKTLGWKTDTDIVCDGLHLP
jgi:hypothetical protein